MPIADQPIKWVKRAAKDVRPGDCDRWGHGHGMENSFRTVSHVEHIGNGIVRIRHRETLPSFYDEYGEDYQIDIASSPAVAKPRTRRPEPPEENTQYPQSPQDRT